MTIIRHPILICLLWLSVAVTTLAATPERSAEEAVEQYIDDLLVLNSEIRTLYESDRESYYRLIEEELDKFIDFREVARGVMARYGTGPNGATSEQLDRFAVVFKGSVIDFYGSALASYDGQTFEILESREQSEQEDAATVRMRVIGDSGGGFEIQYAMFVDEDGIWKLRNLYVEGVNLRRQYYSRFDDLMTRNDYEIDRVIDSWHLAE